MSNYQTEGMPGAESSGGDLEHRAVGAVIKNTVLALIIAAGCVMIILLVFNRPLVYRIFPWVEPTPVEEVSPDEGIYMVTTDRMQMIVADPTLRPDLYVAVEFTWACGCKGSFVPAHEGQYAMYHPEEVKKRREQSICPKCRKKQEQLKEWEEMKGEGKDGQSAESSEGTTSEENITEGK